MTICKNEQQKEFHTDANERNQVFTLLSGIAILLVILGHLDFNVLTIGGLFPYYSFHVMIFMFVSGYFYKEEYERQIGKYILRKAKHLMLPYFCWNLFYGILVNLLHFAGFSYGEPLNFRSFFIEPFLGGHQYMLHFPSWFVPALFLVQVCNVLGRRLLSILRLKKEWLITICTLLVGMAVVYLAKTGHVWGYYKLPGRILFMLPVFEFGCFYKKYLEKWDKAPIFVNLAVVLLIQVIIKFTCGGLAFSAVWCTSFAGAPFVPYLTTVTGTYFWLQIAKLLNMLRVKNPVTALVYKMGDDSFSLMMHHVFGFFLLNTVFYMGRTIFVGFDTEFYKNTVDYLYLPGSSFVMKCLYLVCGVCVAFVLGMLQKKGLNILHGLTKRKNL